VAHAISDYAPVALVRAAAALQLCPENVQRLYRLQRLAALSAAHAQGPVGKPPSASALREILRSTEITNDFTLGSEDNYDDVLIQSVDFPSGTFLVSPGCFSGAAWKLNTLLTAIFRKESLLPRSFVAAVWPVAAALLELSNEVLRAAGMTKGESGSRNVPDKTIYLFQAALGSRT
jgi:hypothetical protein